MTLSALRPRVGIPLTAVLTDPDGGVTDVGWVWERSEDRAGWTAISDATSTAYTPTTEDEGHYLRITASYADRRGGSKTAYAEPDAPVTEGIDEEFTDVDDTNVHKPAIDALASQGVFVDTECGDELFCPDLPMTRWAMAVWILRILADEPDTVLGVSRFADIAPGHWWIRYVERLFDRKITIGCKLEPFRYCPRPPRHQGPDGQLPGSYSRPRTGALGRLHGHRPHRARRQHRRVVRGRDNDRVHHRTAPVLPLRAGHKSPDGHVPVPHGAAAGQAGAGGDLRRYRRAQLEEEHQLAHRRSDRRMARRRAPTRAGASPAFDWSTTDSTGQYPPRSPPSPTSRICNWPTTSSSGASRRVRETSPKATSTGTTSRTANSHAAPVGGMPVRIRALEAMD